MVVLFSKKNPPPNKQRQKTKTKKQQPVRRFEAAQIEPPVEFKWWFFFNTACLSGRSYLAPDERSIVFATCTRTHPGQRQCVWVGILAERVSIAGWSINAYTYNRSGRQTPPGFPETVAVDPSRFPRLSCSHSLAAGNSKWQTFKRHRTPVKDDSDSRTIEG